MDNIRHLSTVKDCNAYWGVPDRHPLVNVIHGEEVGHLVPNCRKCVDLYVIFLKDGKCVDSLKYGRGEYDYKENTLVFTSPGQVFGYPADGTSYEPKGWCLFFSPELLHGTPLGRHMKDYTFFSYDVDEALHISAQERDTVIDCMRRIDDEIQHGNDRHSNVIIASAIELLLNYSMRFYERQFATRKKVNRDVLSHFEVLLDDYFVSDRPKRIGTPTVAWFASQLHLSANYFGDLVKQETGKSAIEHIQRKMVNTAKDYLLQSGLTISEIAYRMGYQYPQYFTRAFKNLTGCTPNAYRTQIGRV